MRDNFSYGSNSEGSRIRFHGFGFRSCNYLRYSLPSYLCPAFIPILLPTFLPLPSRLSPFSKSGRMITFHWIQGCEWWWDFFRFQPAIAGATVNPFVLLCIQHVHVHPNLTPPPLLVRLTANIWENLGLSFAKNWNLLFSEPRLFYLTTS